MKPSDFPSQNPYSLSGGSVAEFTVRAVVLGVILSAVMCAANVYLGLKAGMTVSASIPASVVSMGILRGIMRRGTILENNIVQTMASAGESLAAGIIFTIPGLILTGVWLKFDYWTTSLVALLGGILGIMFMIPLRRTLIVEEVELKYPCGVACAQVLEAGDKGGSAIWNILIALIIGALVTGFIKVIAILKGTVEFPIRLARSAAAGFGLDISAALIGVGYIVGFNIAVLVFIGGAIAWFIAIPVALSINWPMADGEALHAMEATWNIWNNQIRYMGVGAMVVGGLWSIFCMRKGIVKGISDAFGGYKEKKEQEGRLLRTDTDMPFKSIAIIAFLMVIGIFILYGMVTKNRVITAKGGFGVVLIDKESAPPIYGFIPLAKEGEFEVEGTLYESYEKSFIGGGGGLFTEDITVKKEIIKEGLPQQKLIEGMQLTLITNMNQRYSGTVVKEKPDSIILKMEIERFTHIPTHELNEPLTAKPGEDVSLDWGKYKITGKLIAVKEGTKHILTNDGQRFIFGSEDIVSEKVQYRPGISLIAVIAMIVTGFFFVAVSSYIAGLVGSSNNPVSGMIICTVLFTSGLLLLFGFTGNLGILAVLGVAGVVCCAAATAGDVSQDLKTGWLVKATPAKQQYAQVIGVAAAAFLIAPVMGMLHNAYTIGSKDLAAPQAGMFASIVEKIFHKQPFPWEMALVGVGLAIALIVIDEILKSKKSSFRTHVMPVAVGIYLPIMLAVPILIGGVLSLIASKLAGADDKAKDRVWQKGVLFCAGLIAGEAIMGILVGGLKAATTLPISIWPEGVTLLPDILSVVVIVIIGALVLVVSLSAREKKTIDNA